MWTTGPDRLVSGGQVTCVVVMVVRAGESRIEGGMDGEDAWKWGSGGEDGGVKREREVLFGREGDVMVLREGEKCLDFRGKREGGVG
ncbi:hypothetical protein Pcinc_040327 [Petrolisthes cinctipes]|uniref:Uncharacterized protein n=1 Tax=Petrolisthes cinctipes TaxID=88211 RepID=A0AAE1BM46_PETCI|nr:hypothetical protein Pcinc_040327 [Petrolisthes cinctipes]